MTTKDSRLSAWMHNGRLSFICWLLALVCYVAFRFAKIDDDVVTNTLIALTGVLVGNLGIAQGIRSARTEERTVRTARKVDDLEQFAAEAHPDKAAADSLRITALEENAKASETRETEWSLHKDHEGDRDE